MGASQRLTSCTHLMKVMTFDLQSLVAPEESRDNMTIEERLENMERELGRQKRRKRWLLGVILLVVAGSLIVPVLFETTAFRTRAQVKATAKEIRARSFILEDEYGRRRAELSLVNNIPGLALYDENVKPRASWRGKGSDDKIAPAGKKVNRTHGLQQAKSVNKELLRKVDTPEGIKLPVRGSALMTAIGSPTE